MLATTLYFTLKVPEGEQVALHAFVFSPAAIPTEYNFSGSSFKLSTTCVLDQKA